MSKPMRPPLSPASSQKTSNRPPIQQKRTTPVAPPVYRPQPAPRALQPKAAAPQAKKAPVAPPVATKGVPAAPPAYRPQPTPKVLQRKTAISQQPSPATRPQRGAPPAYRPQPTPRVLQPTPHPHGAQAGHPGGSPPQRSEEHTSELQSRQYLVCRLL